MAVNNFNLGRDGAKFTIVDSVNGNVTFNGMVSAKAKSRSTILESETIYGKTIFRAAHGKGWEGDFKFDRCDASVDRFFAEEEVRFYAGLPPSTITITQTVNETDGTRTKWQYTGVAMVLSDAGEWKGLDKVSQSVEFKASDRIPL